MCETKEFVMGIICVLYTLLCFGPCRLLYEVLAQRYSP